MTATDPGPKTPVVDSHHHVWDLSVRDRAWLHEDQVWADEDSLAKLRRSFTMADLEPEAAAAGVVATVVVQTEAEPAETPELLALAAGHPLVDGVVGWVDLMQPGAGEAIAALRELPGGEHLAGLRHPVLTEPDDAWLRRPEVLSGLTEVAAAGLVYDVVCLQRQLPGALAAAEALPALTVVLDHVGNPEDEPPGDGPWATIMRSLGALPNTVCKLSGILSAPLAGPGQVDPVIRQYYEVVLDAFGPDRLMFGSDWPVCTLGSSYPAVFEAAQALTAALSPAEQAAVFGETARRTYRLGAAGL
ncbi:MAG TPA: amidohydrolase family protein [Streptosporangiaceae bacterium]|jgi:L-fuconolactonase|nr:amidohydrolase family protein [Streptosporangiaceae bacterium]